MTYQELSKLFRQFESNGPSEHLTAYITFSSFGPDVNRTYSEKSRTYAISSDNKAFKPNLGGYSIFGYCLDGTDPSVRLDRLMAAEHGGKNGWIVEDCCIVGYLLFCSNERDLQIPRLFYSFGTATEVMLRALCKEGNLEYEDIRRIYDQYQCEYIDDCYGMTRRSAWLNAPQTGNWDWVIRQVRIYHPLKLVIEDAE